MYKIKNLAGAIPACSLLTRRKPKVIEEKLIKIKDNLSVIKSYLIGKTVSKLDLRRAIYKIEELEKFLSNLKEED